jgi:hypothetical protein
MTEGVERVRGLDSDPEQLAGLLVLDSDEDGIRVVVPQQRHVNSVGAPLIEFALHVSSSRFVVCLRLPRDGDLIVL